MKYEKGSFLVIPNRDGLFGLEPYVQSVYFWICNYADSDGVCFPSRTTLAKCAGCSVKSVDRAFEVLSEKGMLLKKTRRNGERNLTNLYQLMILDSDMEGGRDSQSPPRDSQSLGVGTHSRRELYPVLTEPTEEGVAIAPPIIEVMQEDEKPAKRSKAKYNDARVAFGWLPNRQGSWENDLTQLGCGLLLFKRGEEAVRKFVKYVQFHSDDDGWNYNFTKPSDYERKWEDIKAYAKRNR